MAKRKFEAGIELKQVAIIDSVTVGFLGLAAKSDGVYIRTSAGLEGKVWHSANDGSGSGLDADKLDGHEASYFQQAISVNPAKLLGRHSATAGAFEEITIGAGLELDGSTLKATAGLSSSYVMKAGDTMTGDLLISKTAVGDATGTFGLKTDAGSSRFNEFRITNYTDVDIYETDLSMYDDALLKHSMLRGEINTVRGKQLFIGGTNWDSVSIHAPIDVIASASYVYVQDGSQNVKLVPISSFGGGSGTVTSVALSMPNIFSVSGSPITSSGTFNVSLAQQGVHAFFAGPADVATGVPVFRTIQESDLPVLLYQAADQDLTAIAGLTGTGYLSRRGDGLWELTAGSTSGLTYSKIELSNSPSPITASTWTNIPGVSLTITESGRHLVSCHVSLVMGSAAGYVAARIRVGTTVIASGETYQNYRADFHLSTVTELTGNVTIQIYSSVSGTSPVASTQTSGSASATLLHVVKIA